VNVFFAEGEAGAIPRPWEQGLEPATVMKAERTSGKLYFVRRRLIFAFT
jgi:hypothetical protein